ncbi:MAG: cupredoxin domain-containing protein [Nitrososphaeraceae archaeon]
MSLIAILTISIFSSNNVFGQGIGTLENNNAQYAVSIIPGAAQKESLYHYFPPNIAVPTGTTVAWFNNDLGQPHTVTSGAIGDPDSGSIFNSGIMPATTNSFFQYTFANSGEVVYHCEIHPWRVGIVTSSNAMERGNNFEVLYGAGVIWDTNKNPRTLLDFKPLTIPLDQTSTITYNITIYDLKENKPVFSSIFNTIGESLPIELISGVNETRSYGPDFSSTGAYHIMAGFLENKDSEYKIKSEISAINSKQPENPITDEFNLRIVA